MLRLLPLPKARQGIRCGVKISKWPRRLLLIKPQQQKKVVETAKVDKSKTFTPQYALNAKNVNKTAEARVANPKLGVTIASGLTKPKAKELLRENSFGLPKAQIKNNL